MYKAFKNITILVAEDELELAKLMTNAIGEYFKKFIIVHDGEEALKAYHQYHPDIVVTDILMPKLTGLELLQKIREVDEKIPIVILSAHSDSPKLLKAIDYSVSKYFIKPFDPDDLLEYLEKSIEKLHLNSIKKLGDNFTFDLQKQKLFYKKILIELTKREVLFMTLLVEQKKQTCNDKLIKRTLWGDENISHERLRTFIRRLRAKTSKNLIINNSGFGYTIATL
ncbi:MAG: response regulator transcription factor [Sulfurovaceae bacterium]|nr:response regulator transcription factor [Sulfurovaceae bacterium]